MQLSKLLFAVAFIGGAAYSQTPGILDRINVPEKVIAPRNPTLSGTWMLELRRPGQTVVTLGMATYLAEGTVIGPTADRNTSASHGTWIRITDGKFVQTVYIFVSDHVKTYFLDVGRPSRISAEWVMYQSSG